MNETIPNDVMAEAMRIWRDDMGFVNDRIDQTRHIARAILAERERAAKMVERAQVADLRPLAAAIRGTDAR